MLRKNKLWRALWLAIFFLLVGTLGYSTLEGYSLTDALYMTVITASTVGFGEIHPLSEKGRIFTILFILSGVSCLAYAVSLLTEFVFERASDPNRWKKNMEKRISTLKKHTIICGSGRVGSITASQLEQSGSSFVIIEADQHRIEVLKELNYLFLEGDATREAILLKAGIKEASALLAMLGSDPENLFTVLTARELNPTLHIIARCEKSASEKRILRAGADSIVSPYVSAGKTVAKRILAIPGAQKNPGTPPDQNPQWIIDDLATPCYGKTVTEAEEFLGTTILGIRYNGHDKLMPARDDIIVNGAEVLCFPPPAHRAFSVLGSPAPKIKVVFIDDNPVICRLYTRLFQKAGLDVHFAQTGQQGITLVQNLRPDAVIIDYHLPDIDGASVIAAIRTMEHGDQVKLILFTANEDEDVKNKALVKGANAIVIKSPEASEIVARVTNILT